MPEGCGTWPAVCTLLALSGYRECSSFLRVRFALSLRRPLTPSLPDLGCIQGMFVLSFEYHQIDTVPRKSVIVGRIM